MRSSPDHFGEERDGEGDRKNTGLPVEFYNFVYKHCDIQDGEGAS